jgi:hypothetical protein
MRKSHSEHFSTAVPQKADVVLTAANGSFVPEGDIPENGVPDLLRPLFATSSERGG